MLHMEDIDNMFGICRNKGENQFLSDIMIDIRRKRPQIKKEPHFTISIFESGIAQVWIQTPPCRYSQAGKCTICNYWKGNRILNVIDELMENCTIPDNCSMLLINTCGNCLDPYELSLKDQEKLWDWINNQKCQGVILETHADTLLPDRMIHIKDRIPNKELYFEIGIETVSKDVLLYCLNKRTPKISLEKIVSNVHEIGGKLIANVILGAPFLNQKEQVEDAINSIQTLMEKGVDYVTLFPINIKPYTLTKMMYENGMYELVTGNMIIETLSGISPEYLPRVDLSWYGERSEEGLLTPDYCPKCQGDFVQMIGHYNKTVSKDDRQRALEIIKAKKCTCQRECNPYYDMEFSKRIEYGYSKIKDLAGKHEEEMN